MPRAGPRKAQRYSLEFKLALPQPTEEDLDLDREIEHAFDAEEPMTGTRGPVGDVE